MVATYKKSEIMVLYKLPVGIRISDNEEYLDEYDTP